jgi:hypothetical protein
VTPPKDAGPASCATGCSPGLACLTNSEFPAGACSAPCDPAGVGCPSGAVCSPPLSSGSSYCLLSCTASCPDGLLCTPTALGSVCLAAAAAVPEATTTCVPPQILVGAEVGPASDPGCQLAVVDGGPPAGQVQHLGTRHPGETVSFEVPQGAAGFSVVSQVVSMATAFIDCPGLGVFANVPVPTPVLTPQGTTFFDFVAFEENPPLDLSTLPLLFQSIGGQQPFTAAVTFPNTSAGVALALDGGLPGGQWTFQVNDYANEFRAPYACDGGPGQNTYDVSVVVTPGPLPTTGQLAVDVYLLTNNLFSSQVQTHRGVQFFVKRFASFFAKAGICVTAVTFHDAPRWAIDKYSALTLSNALEEDPCGDFRQMMTLAAPSRSMALFFVDDIVSSAEAANGVTLLGETGAIPGLSSFNGTIAGGAVVASLDISSYQGCGPGFDPFGCGADLVAVSAAHETGHSLGLFHPTEQTGDSFDPLTDTAACVCALCETKAAAVAACSANKSPTLVDNSVCSGGTRQCGGANLLMFWLTTTDDRGDISPQEGAILRANPVVSTP